MYRGFSLCQCSLLQQTFPLPLQVNHFSTLWKKVYNYEMVQPTVSKILIGWATGANKIFSILIVVLISWSVKPQVDFQAIIIVGQAIRAFPTILHIGRLQPCSQILDKGGKLDREKHIGQSSPSAVTRKPSFYSFTHVIITQATVIFIMSKRFHTRMRRNSTKFG